VPASFQPRQAPFSCRAAALNRAITHRNSPAGSTMGTTTRAVGSVVCARGLACSRWGDDRSSMLTAGRCAVHPLDCTLSHQPSPPLLHRSPTKPKQCTDDSNYVGEYAKGKRHGYGVYSFPNGDQYTGEYEEDLPQGYGVYVFASGQKYEGHWEKGKKHGWSIYTVETGWWGCGLVARGRGGSNCVGWLGLGSGNNAPRLQTKHRSAMGWKLAGGEACLGASSTYRHRGGGRTTRSRAGPSCRRRSPSPRGG